VIFIKKERRSALWEDPEFYKAIEDLELLSDLITNYAANHCTDCENGQDEVRSQH
jgi:hypothetical protein